MRLQTALFLGMSPLAAVSLGCTHSTLEVSHVPNPVLIGPVDRVGGHRAVDAKTVAVLDEEVLDTVSASTKSERIGGMTLRTTEVSAKSTQGSAISRSVLSKTEGRAERDVRVERLPVGAWAMILGGTGLAERWVGIRGQVVEVRR